MRRGWRSLSLRGVNRAHLRADLARRRRISSCAGTEGPRRLPIMGLQIAHQGNLLFQLGPGLHPPGKVSLERKKNTAFNRRTRASLRTLARYKRRVVHWPRTAWGDGASPFRRVGPKGARMEVEDSPLPRQFDVVIERDEEGYYIASVPQLPGCHTQARSLDEVTQRIREAVELCLEVAGAPEQTLEFVGIQRITIAA